MCLDCFQKHQSIDMLELMTPLTPNVNSITIRIIDQELMELFVKWIRENKDGNKSIIDLHSIKGLCPIDFIFEDHKNDTYIIAVLSFSNVILCDLRNADIMIFLSKLMDLYGGSMKITKSYLRRNPDHIFVFGDNLQRKGRGGAAKLRDETNTYGFITKKAANNNSGSFYKPKEYEEKFNSELKKLVKEIERNPDKIFLISKLGGGLANKYSIYEKIIRPGLSVLKEYENVVFLEED